MNKETLRMQMLAGLITESQYKNELTENEQSYVINYDKLKQILLLACKIYPQGEDGSALYDKSYIKDTIKYIMILDKGVKNKKQNVFDKLEDEYLETFESFVFLDDAQQQRWNKFDDALTDVSSSSDEYDLEEAQDALKNLSIAIDDFQL